MKWLLRFAAFCVGLGIALPAFAQCTIPVTLQNGTIADATQVMSNFNALAGCVNNVLSSFAATVQSYGCVGDGVTDDTACVQRASDTAAAAGLTLVFDSAHLYSVNTINITQPARWDGPFRYGIWKVNQPTGSGTQACTWGLLARNPATTLVNATAMTGTIHGLCIDMTGNPATQATAGAAINLAPASVQNYQSGWDIQYNTILQPWDGIDINGAGVPSPIGCCGQGTTADGNVVSHNTIVSPNNAAINNGKNSVFAATIGNIVEDNNIVCGKSGTHRGDGIVVYDGGMWYSGTQNGPEGCNRGFAVIPGKIGANPQWAQINADGVFGDQSIVHDLVIQPASGGIVWPFSAGGRGPWANATNNHVAAYIDCTATLSRCEDIRLENMYFGGGSGSTGPLLDVEGGDGGPYALQVTGSRFCQQGALGAGAAVMTLNAGGPNGQVGAGGYHWVFTGNVFSGCGSGVSAPTTGVNLTIAATNPVGGEIAFVGNDFSLLTTPIAYTPNTTINDNVVLSGNLGADTALPMITAITNTAWPGVFQRVAVAGPTTIATMGGGYFNQKLIIHAATSNFIFSHGASVGALCGPADLTLVVGNDYQFQWLGIGFGSCWAHLS